MTDPLTFGFEVLSAALNHGVNGVTASTTAARAMILSFGGQRLGLNRVPMAKATRDRLLRGSQLVSKYLARCKGLTPSICTRAGRGSFASGSGYDVNHPDAVYDLA